MSHSKEFPFGKRYDVMEEIGHGGMGRVYKVYDSVRSETLALKELSRHHVGSAAAMLGFKNEFRLMTEFQHPNIVKVFDFGMSEENIPFITMEFVPGNNLSELSDFSVEQVVDILIQICQVLACIHSRLYVHRDLKPDNIKCLTKGMSVKLLDFGLMSQMGIPASGKISGTYYYIAPEAIVGGIIDESTDLYSVGIIGYELLTGRRPFTGSKTQILQGHLKQTPPEPTSFRSDIPLSVKSIIMKLIEKDKSRRYRNTSEVLHDLQYLTGKTRHIETVQLQHGYLYSSKLIGREEEIEHFNKTLQHFRQGQSVSLFIGSPAGIGKTRLLNEMKTLAELEGIRTLYMESRNWKPETEHLDHAPMVLLLDDMHWMDIKVLQNLNELIRNKEKYNLLIIASFRNDEVDKTSPLWHTIEENLSEYRVLSPLTQQQTRSLIENLLYPSPISDEFITYCFKNSGGNGFDLIEFLRYLITEGYLTKSGERWLEPVNLGNLSLPAKLEERLILRTYKLSDDTRTLAIVGAILGDELDLESWQKVSEYEEERFFLGIDELISNQIIIKTNGHYRFGHDKIRAAIYESLDFNQKKGFHLKAAKFLETKITENHQELIPVIARHFVAACDSDKAIQYSIQAAKAAEHNKAEWEAFDHYRHAVPLLETNLDYPDRDKLLLEIYEKAAQFSSAAWIDASTCLQWLQKAIDVYVQRQNMEKVFGLSLSYVVTCAITGNYPAARRKIPEIIETCDVKEQTLSWAILYGAGVCLVDWYQGYQNDCFNHAVSAIRIFEQQLDTLPADVWPAYSWSLFWRDKARAYLGKSVDMANVEKIRQLMVDEKSDKTIYWHTLTAVTARAAFTGRWADLLEWKHLASQLSREMGKIYWFECWISHSYLYGALQHGEFFQLENHIEKVQASPDPYQVRLAWLFRGILALNRSNYQEAKQNLTRFFEMEQKNPDNSYLEGFIYLARTYLCIGEIDKAKDYIEKGAQLAEKGVYSNPLYQLQFLQLKAELGMIILDYSHAESYLIQSLQLARLLDNPIQTAFIRKLWGRWYLDRNNKTEAENQLNQAKDIFLSLNNKYQAGKVVAILESIAGSQTEDVTILKSTKRETYPDTETRIEEAEFEKTKLDEAISSNKRE